MRLAGAIGRGVLAVATVVAAAGCGSDPTVTVLPGDDGVTVINTWLVAGVFPSPPIPGAQPGEPQREGLVTDYLTALGGEANARIRPGTRVATPAGDTLTFLVHEWPRDYANLIDLYGRMEQVCAYLYTEVETDDTLRTMIHVGANDNCRAWLGGREVALKVEDTEVEPSQVATCVTIPPGRTPLLVKVDQAGGKGWGAHVAFFDSLAHPGLRAQMIAEFNKYYAYPRTDLYRLRAQYAVHPERYIAVLESLRTEHPGSWILEEALNHQLLDAYSKSEGDVEEMQRFASGILKYEPTAAWVIAERFERRGRHDLALAYTSSAMASFATDTTTYPEGYNRARGVWTRLTRNEALSRLGAHEEALAELRAVRDSVGGAPLAHLAETFARAGMRDSALVAYRELLRRVPDKAEYREAYYGLVGDDPDAERFVQALSDSARQAHYDTLLSHRIDIALPPFTLETLHHGTVSNESLAGKVVILDLWSTGCVPCVGQLPLLQDAYARLQERGNVTALAVNLGEEQGMVEAYCRARNFTMPVGLLPQADVRAYLDGLREALSLRGRIGIPLTIVVGPDGRMKYWNMGAYPGYAGFADDVVWMVNSVLDES